MLRLPCSVLQGHHQRRHLELSGWHCHFRPPVSQTPFTLPRLRRREATKAEPFNLVDGSTLQTAMMRQEFQQGRLQVRGSLA